MNDNYLNATGMLIDDNNNSSSSATIDPLSSLSTAVQRDETMVDENQTNMNQMMDINELNQLFNNNNNDEIIVSDSNVESINSMIDSSSSSDPPIDPHHHHQSQLVQHQVDQHNQQQNQNQNQNTAMTSTSILNQSSIASTSLSSSSITRRVDLLSLPSSIILYAIADPLLRDSEVNSLVKSNKWLLQILKPYKIKRPLKLNEAAMFSPAVDLSPSSASSSLSSSSVNQSAAASIHSFTLRHPRTIAQSVIDEQLKAAEKAELLVKVETNRQRYRFGVVQRIELQMKTLKSESDPVDYPTDPLEAMKRVINLNNVQRVQYSYYNRAVDISGFVFPRSLTILDLWNAKGDLNVSDLRHLTLLKSLKLPTNFNTPVDNVVWPPQLTCLVFGDDFNQPLRQWRPPSLLTSLSLGRDGIRIGMNSQCHLPYNTST